VGVGVGVGACLLFHEFRRGGPSNHQEDLVRSSGAPHTATQRDVSEGHNH